MGRKMLRSHKIPICLMHLCTIFMQQHTLSSAQVTVITVHKVLYVCRCRKAPMRVFDFNSFAASIGPLERLPCD